MHRNKRTRLALLLAVCGLATVPLASPSPSSSPSSNDGAAVASDPGAPVVERRARGRFDLPGPLMPGNLAGVLLRDGEAVFEIDAVLLRDGDDGPGGTGGTIRGGARRLHGPNAGRLFRLRGSWEGDGHGHGVYHAVLLPLPPASDEQATEPEAVIRLRGHFVDANGPALPPGRFVGRWMPVDLGDGGGSDDDAGDGSGDA